MIWNNIPGNERLRLWKKLRDDSKELPLEEKLSEVAKFCASMPYGSRSLDYYTPSSWPTPWEILFYGTFCTSSISLLMYYTLVMLIDDAIDLYLVEDQEAIYLLPVVNNHFVLNYHLGQVSIYSEIQNDLKVLQKYTKSEIKTIT